MEFGEHVQPEQPDGLPLGLPLPDKSRPIEGINTPLASLMVLSELLPLNFATLAAAQAIYDNRITTTICLAQQLLRQN